MVDDQAARDAGLVLPMPVTVLQQDWGAALGYDAADVWRTWAPDLVHRTVDGGHFMAEEAPDLVAEALLVVAAVVDVSRLAGDHRSDEPVVHLGYVVASVLLLPILARPVRTDADADADADAEDDDDRRGRQLVLAIACLAVLVVVWRQRVTA